MAEHDEGIWQVDTDRHVRGSSARAILRYVERVLGKEAADEVVAVAAARDGHTEHPAHWIASWMSHAAICHLAAAAAEACGDPDIGRRAGEEGMRILHERGIAELLRSTGSVTAAAIALADGANKTSDGRVHRVIPIDDHHLDVVATYVPPGFPDPFFCSNLTGFLVGIPPLFGGVGFAAEPECMSRGDEHCRYEVRWTLTDDQHGPTTPVASATGAADAFLERFEQLHTMATELAQADDLETLLERVTDRASTSVRARRHALAIRTADGRVHVHQRGFAADQVDAFADKLLADGIGDDPSTLVVDVASATRHYGRMAAVFPRGSSVNDLERRLLAAYARHAAAAIESVSDLESARTDRDTARALLTLARALSDVGTFADVGGRVAAAIPFLAPCDKAHVWLWDAELEALRLEGRYPEVEVPAGEEPLLSTAQHGKLLSQLAAPEPFIVTADDTTRELACLLEAASIDRAAFVPIRRRGEFLGVVVSGVRHAAWAADTEADLLVRLRGLADQAATAVENAALLDRVRQQSLHDPLTGLPNRALVQERAEQALAFTVRTSLPVSLLFIDLDRFKQVNDTLGHAAGDELIQQVAARIGSRLRQSDTLGRLGGDEYVVLLPQATRDGAERVADDLRVTLAHPFQLGAGTASIGASIGIATAPLDGTDYDTLLRAADHAMYAAKADRGPTAAQPV